MEAQAGYHETRPRGRSRALLVLGLALALLASAMSPALSAEGGTERVSVDGTGADPDGDSHDPAVSGDGRYVAFASEASDLVAGDGNSTTDVFVVDRVAGTTRRVSVDTGGGDADDSSTAPAISADGRYVAFTSAASDLVTGDGGSTTDVFVRDRLSGTTERVSVDTDGADPNGGSSDPSISADGRYVAFASDASDLVAGDTNVSTDVFVHDRESDSTERVSLGADPGGPSGDSSGAAISADGRHVAFDSAADDIDANDANSFTDVFVHDRETNETERVSVDSGEADPNGDSIDPTLSANGRYVAFVSRADDLVDEGPANSNAAIFIRDRTAQATARASFGPDGGDPNDESFEPAISASGRYVAFGSAASDLIPGDTNGVADIFVHDREAGTTDRASLDPQLDDPDGDSSGAAISADGRYVAFQSAASDLVADDDNSFDDVFLHDFLGPPELLLTPPSHVFGTQAVAAGPTDAFTFTVQNIGGGTMNIASIGLSGGGAGHLAIASETCGPTLPAGEGCDVNVVFDPTSAGHASAVLEVSSDGGDRSSSLSGQGTAPAAALSPGSRDFGVQRTDAGPAGPQGFTLSNTGTATLNIASIGLGGVGAGQFAIVSKTCHATLAPGASCEISVVFDPSAPGTASALLSVHSDGGSVIGSLAGSGTSPPASTGSDPGGGPGPTPQPGPGPKPGSRPRCSGRIATVVGAGRGATIKGTAGRDVIVGTSGNDRIRGGGGRDLICGRGGDDRLLGGAAGDDLHGDAGDDSLAGNGGGDSLHGDGGADVLSGGGAGDKLNGGSGRDRLDGGGGSDKLRGGGGIDHCRDGRAPQRTC